MTLRAIDDAVADLRLRGAAPFTMRDVMAVGALQAALLAARPNATIADEWLALG
jgi:hypothetical protein